MHTTNLSQLSLHIIAIDHANVVGRKRRMIAIAGIGGETGIRIEEIVRVRELANVETGVETDGAIEMTEMIERVGGQDVLGKEAEVIARDIGVQVPDTDQDQDRSLQ